jgi:uncharacterized membrane protein YphA (DoxX/SURF4 family)
MIASEIKTVAKSGELNSLWLTLKLTYGLVPIVAGADKFFNILTDWGKYLSPDLISLLPFSASTFMLIVGIIEIAAGILVLTKTELGAYVVAAWLVCIALTLILSWSFVDVAVRDVVMAIGSFTLARLTKLRSENA